MDTQATPGKAPRRGLDRLKAKGAQAELYSGDRRAKGELVDFSRHGAAVKVQAEVLDTWTLKHLRFFTLVLHGEYRDARLVRIQRQKNVLGQLSLVLAVELR